MKRREGGSIDGGKEGREGVRPSIQRRAARPGLADRVSPNEPAGGCQSSESLAAVPCGVVLEAGELGRPTPLNGRFGAPLFDSAKIETAALERRDHARVEVQ